MPIRSSDTIIGKPRGSSAEALAFAEAVGSKRLNEVEAYLGEVYALAPAVGIDPALVVAQSALETNNWRDSPWRERLNPAGMGVTDGHDFGHAWDSGSDAARGQIVHLWLYARGGPLHEQLAPFAHLDPRRDVLKDTWYGANRTLASLGGKWAAELDYGQRIANRSPDIFLNLPDQEKTAMTTKPYILITAGHRFTDAEDSPERRRTKDLAIAYTQAFRDAGYDADWWQRDLDGDDEPTLTVGGLDTVAAGTARELENRPESRRVLLDLHYNGPHSAAHVIVPDCVGLTTLVQGGAPVSDTASNNTLDVNLARAICHEIVEATGLTKYSGFRLGIPGVMSERDSRWGEQGIRLGMFAHTAKQRHHAARMVIEHGGFSDDPAVEAGFEDRCAAAAVKAVTEVFAERERAAGPAPQPDLDRRLDIPQPAPIPVP